MRINSQSTPRDVKDSTTTITMKVVVVVICAQLRFVPIGRTWKRHRHNSLLLVEAL
jgi:hypothetical protein